MLYKIILTVYYKDGVSEGDLLNLINIPYALLAFFKFFIEAILLMVYFFLNLTLKELKTSNLNFSSNKLYYSSIIYIGLIHLPSFTLGGYEDALAYVFQEPSRLRTIRVFV
jgi:hypothetical protein